MVDELRRVAGFEASPAWHDELAQHPWAAVLEAEAPTIQAELHQSLSDVQQDEAWSGADYTAIAPSWRFTHLWQEGAWLPEAAARYPSTVALLQRLEATHGLRLNPLQNVACGFARQPHGSGIAPHCDGNLLGLTAHLGLAIPPSDDCWIEVRGERRQWREGQLLLMDTTYTHSTHNGGTSDRYILMLNVLRPGVDLDEVQAFRHYMQAPPLRLDGINPGWLRVPPCSHSPRSKAGADKCAVLVCAPSRVDDDAGRVLLDPAGAWEAQRGRGGSAGLVRIEPLDNSRYRATSVVGSAGLQPRQWPAPDAAVCEALPVLREGCEVRPCAGAIDAEGSLEWLALPVGESSEWLLLGSGGGGGRADGEGVEAVGNGAGTTARPPPLSIIRAHLELLRDPARHLAWVPVWTDDDERLLESVVE